MTMKKILLIILFLPMIGFGQKTYIPDDNFEGYLENQGWGDGIAFNDSVYTNNINILNALVINNLGVSDLTGIEDFTALTDLYFDNNPISNLDLSYNSNLVWMQCQNNNNLTSINLNGLTNLTYLYCEYNNSLTSLDLSQNTALEIVECRSNNLNTLDLRNDNNINITQFIVTGNTNLNCIHVDDASWAQINWTVSNGNIDATQGFSDNTITTEIACDSYTWIVNGQTYTASGTYTHSFTNASGCVASSTLNLTINNSPASTDTQVHCDTYTWIDGNTYTASNNSATYVYTNATGCDSIITLNLTINNSISSTDTQVHCDTYTWIDGNTYTASNNSATYVYTNIAGCDSTVNLDLTINLSPNTTNISGLTNVDFLQIETYSVVQNINSTFFWYLNSGGIILNGGNTNSVEVQWNNNIGTYQLYVVETSLNGCSDTSFIDINVADITEIQDHTSTNKKLLKITNLLGKETNQKNQTLLYLYNDGTVEKKIIIE